MLWASENGRLTPIQLQDIPDNGSLKQIIKNVKSKLSENTRTGPATVTRSGNSKRSTEEANTWAVSSQSIVQERNRMHESQEADRAQKESNMSLLKTLNPSQKRLFTTLCKSDFVSEPMMSPFMTVLIMTSSPQKAIGLIKVKAGDWEGTFSEGSFHRFLSNGFLSLEASRGIPGGFTVFMFHPKTIDMGGSVRHTYCHTLGILPSQRVRGVEGEKGTKRRHLTSDSLDFFSEPPVGPEYAFDPPVWFLEELARIAVMEDPPVPTKLAIVFENTSGAAAENERALEAFDFDIEKLIAANQSTTLGCGSEFRPVNQPRPLLNSHPNFGDLSKVLESRMSYVFDTELDVLTQSEELRKLLKRGNHKLTQEFAEKVNELITKDVVHGFAIPIPVSVVEKIPHAAVQPLGLARQWSIKNEKGERIKNFRMSQDLSFSSSREGEPTSINKRIDMSAYTEMIFGWCLPRILHFIVAIRNEFPRLLILIAKYDYSDAYRRIAHSASAAAQTIAIHAGLEYLSLRLTFGGAANPPTWCLLSEMVTDLANEINQCKDWEPDLLHSPAQPTLPSPRRLPSTVPIALGRKLAVDIQMSGDRIGRVYGFIDDLINVFADTPANCRMQPHVVPLAMHVTSRPHAGDTHEPTTRRPLLSLQSPSEIQTVLGWRIDTRRLRIELPDNKFSVWSGDLEKMLRNGGGAYNELDTLVGRLNHASFVLPMARHFMGRLRGALTSRRHKATAVRRGHGCAARPRSPRGLEAVEGDSPPRTRGGVTQPSRHPSTGPSLLVGRLPVRTGRVQHLGAGLETPPPPPPGHIMRGHPGMNNLLEFTAMVVNVWLECLDATDDYPCILAVGDSTSAIGWLFKSSKLASLPGNEHDAHLFVARKQAMVLIEHDACIASQHIKGEMNVVADLLSFAGTSDRGKPHPLAHDDSANDELTQHFRDELTEQVPENFAISQLPRKILCFVMQVLQIAALSLRVAASPDMRMPTDSGFVGGDSAGPTEMGSIHSSLCYLTTKGSFLPRPSSNATGPPVGGSRETLPEIVRAQWSQALCAKPQATWLRRFGAICGTAPCTSRTASTCAPSFVHYSRPSTTKIP